MVRLPSETGGKGETSETRGFEVRSSIFSELQTLSFELRVAPFPQQGAAPRLILVSRFLGAKREHRMGKGASLGKEAVLTDSGRAGEVAAGVDRVRRAAFSASC